MIVAIADFGFRIADLDLDVASIRTPQSPLRNSLRSLGSNDTIPPIVMTIPPAQIQLTSGLMIAWIVTAPLSSTEASVTYTSSRQVERIETSLFSCSAFS